MKRPPLRTPLRPCFACGGPPQASVEIGPSFAAGTISCQRCGARTTAGFTYEQAWLEWNAFAERPVEVGTNPDAGPRFDDREA